jgi:hypothetical protein
MYCAAVKGTLESTPPCMMSAVVEGNAVLQQWQSVWARLELQSRVGDTFHIVGQDNDQAQAG